jgi:predicted protein tyrosine phosphatase
MGFALVRKLNLKFEGFSMNTHLPQIRICGISLLGSAISQFEPDLVISITDPFSDVSKEAEKTLSHKDVPAVMLNYHDAHYGYPGGEPVSFEMFEQVAEALDKHAAGDNPKILVHCHAGLQRSPAMALFALGHIAARTDSLDAARAREIVDAVFAASPQAEPDRRTLDMGSDILDVPGFFHQAMDERREEQHRKSRRRTGKDLRGSKRKRAFRV